MLAGGIHGAAGINSSASGMTSSIGRGMDLNGLNTNSPIGGKGGIRDKFRLGSSGLGTRIASTGAYAKARAKMDLKNGAKSLGKKGARFTRRALVGGLTGGTAALLAAGVGATSPEKAASLIAAAGAGGYSFGNYYGDKVAKIASSYSDGGRTAFWGKDLKAVNQARFDKEFMNDPEVLSNLTMALGSTSAAKKAIEDGRLQAVLNNNITDKGKAAKTLALANRIKSEHSGLSDEQALAYAIGAAKLNRDANPGVFNPGSREEANFKRYIAKQYEAAGMSGNDISKQVQEIMDYMQYFEV